MYHLQRTRQRYNHLKVSTIKAESCFKLSVK
ncbi:hypothetical protein V6Z12_A11G326100 [Gossypium hirsutum]